MSELYLGVRVESDVEVIGPYLREEVAAIERGKSFLRRTTEERTGTEPDVYRVVASSLEEARAKLA